MIRFITLVILCATLTFAQSVEKRTIVRDDANTTSQKTSLNISPLKTVFNVNNSAVGDTISYTQYDYFTNSLIRDMLVVVGGKPYFSPMVRKWGSTRRSVRLIYPDAGAYKEVAIFDTVAANTGWPAIDAAQTGTAVGTIAVVCHTPNRLVVGDAVNGWSAPSQFEAYTDPSVQCLGDTILMGTSGNRVMWTFWRTADYGTTFQNYDSMNAHSFATGGTKEIFAEAQGGLEIGMCKSANEKYFAYFGTASTAAGTAYIDATDKDSVDNVFLLKSSDKGATVKGSMIAKSGKRGTLSNLPNVTPMFANFGQMDMAVANTGVYHAVANGYGYRLDPTVDTVVANEFPVVYWNSSTNTWKSISDRAMDTLNIFSDATYIRHTNAIGQANPNIAVSADGKGIFVVWSAPQITGGKVDTSATGKIYLTDLYYSVSTNGGATFTKPAIFAGAKNAAELYGHPAQLLEDLGTSFRAHVLYLEDMVPGCAIQSQSAYSANPLIYKTFDFSKTTGVNDVVGAKKSFNLEQNYPNPFNPSTSIRFNLGERSTVSLKVFDMLGREVASLVNGEDMSSGSHSVNFNAAKLSSGVYVYTLKAGSFTESKKLTLMK